MDDAQLIQAVRGGDRQAYARLVERYHRRIYGLCFRLLGSVPDAEDLAHEAFVEAWLKLAQLREPAKFGAWLRQVALNLCRARLRRARRAPEPLGDDPAAEPAPPEPVGEIAARLPMHLSRISADHRMVLVLHYIEGLSCEEIARFLDVPAGTVMSRLHRGRRALKRQIDAGEAQDKEDTPVLPDKQFTHEVDAEIAVLLEMFRDDRSGMERLSVILRKSPERFARLVREADGEATIGNLAMLLPQLGPPAAQIVLDCCLAGDAEVSARAAGVLRGAMARAGALPPSGWHVPMPDRGPYFVLDRLIAADFSPADKAAVLIDWQAAGNAPAALLVTNVLMGYRDAAIGLLAERFDAFATVEDLYASPDVLRALCRAGTPFCERLAAELPTAGPPRLGVLLAAVDALGRCLDPRPWLDGATDQQWANEVRTRRKWPPLRPGDVDAGVLRRLIETTAAMVCHERADVREAALAALGRLGSSGHAASIVACASHTEPSTRLAALRALAELGGGDHAPVFLAAAESGLPAERLAAVEALGRLGIRQAQPLLMRLADDADESLQAAAVIALGELGGPETTAFVRRLLDAPGARRKKAAAKALYRGKRTGVHPTPSATARKLHAVIRGGARPQLYSSPGAAVRFALPEMRPYDEREITRRLAALCIDHSLTRRLLVDCGLMRRDNGVYELTEFGQAAWRVEHFILEHYLACAERPGGSGMLP